MSADRQDLAVYQGDDWAGTVTIRNEDGTPADISGYTAQAQIRRAVADADPVVEVEMSATVESPQVHLSIPHDETEGLSGRYVWDLQLIDGAGAITTVLAGKVIVTAEVTREEVA